MECGYRAREIADWVGSRIAEMVRTLHSVTKISFMDVGMSDIY